MSSYNGVFVSVHAYVLSNLELVSYSNMNWRVMGIKVNTNGPYQLIYLEFGVISGCIGLVQFKSINKTIS